MIRIPSVVLSQLRGKPKEVEGSKIENKLLITFRLKFLMSSFPIQKMNLGLLIQNA